jgi:formylglycine-generating enzyme required for sulfatase activity
VGEEHNWTYTWRHPYGRKSDIDRKQDHPVTCISWRDAQAFCRWAGVRLPSEAEWEKVARGGDGRIYPWGDEPPTDRLCNFNEKVGDTTPVGSYPAGASPYGCLDMAGNVWEWTSTLWGWSYPYDPSDGRENLSASDSVFRVMRGGSWYSPASGVGCGVRNDGYPDLVDGYVGVRVVASP